MKKFFHWFMGTGSVAHWQTYHAWRDYPVAMRYLAMVAGNVGFCVGIVAATIIYRLAS